MDITARVGFKNETYDVLVFLVNVNLAD